MGGKKKSDALTALIAEVVDLEQEAAQAAEAKREANGTMIVAQQAHASATDKHNRVIVRYNRTTEALGLITTRDDIAEATVRALTQRERDSRK